jgi:hypothetical protein
MAMTRVADAVQLMAEKCGVCTRPLPIRQVVRATGLIGWLNVPRGARLASKCRSCAMRNLKLRQRQIREGWHLTEEPRVIAEKPTEDVRAALHLYGEFLLLRQDAQRDQLWDQVRGLDEGLEELEEYLAGQRLRGKLPKPNTPRKPRIVRSTRRRQDFGTLPNLPVEDRSIGKLHTNRDGSRSYNHSMLVTLTSPSFGAVHTGNRRRRGQLIACECGRLHGEKDPILGTPLDPASYDHNGHAKALILFSRVGDRFWQNLRRKVGYKIAHAGVVEMQRRLATHAHYAVRGTIPRKLIKQVAAETYYQAWWPQFDQMVYPVDRPPVWDDESKSYVDPKTGQALAAWRPTVEAIKRGDQPAHVATLGTVDVRGIEKGTPEAERTIRYVTKYLTKDLVDQHMIKGNAQQTHFQRLYDELAVLPCSPTCANWLLYGVQPKDAKAGLTPGRCKGKVHQAATLGYTGRRCLVTRNWSNKTLTDHRLDGRAWFQAVTEGDLDWNAPDADKNRYYYQLAGQHDLDVAPLHERILKSITTKLRHRRAIQEAIDRQRSSAHVSAAGVAPATAA